MKLLIRTGGLWLLLLLGGMISAHAQSASMEKVAAIVVTNIGPAAASDELIRANIHVKPGDNYFRASVDQDIINLYQTGFFSNIRINEQRGANGVTVIYLLQGKFRLTGINFEGNTKYSNKKLMKKISSKVGDPLDERKLFNDSQEIQKLYEKAGYQRTVVKPIVGNYDYEAGRANVVFQIQETAKIKIVEVDFTGATAFTQKKLRRVIKTRKHWIFSWLTRSGVFKEDQFDEDKEKLGDFYRNAGYIDFEIKDIRITNPTPNTMKIEFIVFEGSQYKVGAVTIKGNQLFSTEQLYEGFKKQHTASRSKLKVGEHGLEADIGMTFTPDALNHDIKAIEDFYGARGYINVRQGANLRVTKIPNTETGTMDLQYDIIEGEKAYIEKIIIKGNVKTKDKVIRRELAVSPGEVFDMVRVRRSKERLEGLGFFEKVDTKPATTDVPNHDDLVVGVDEKSTGNFTFGAGFNSIESLFGFAEVSQANFDLFNPPYFTGAGQKFRLRVQLGTESQDYLASFVEPWFLGRKLSLGVDLYRSVQNYVSQENLYDVTRTGARVSLTRALGSDFLLGQISYNIEDIGIENVSSNAPNTILNEAGDTLVSRFGTSLTYDTRNSYELANKGQETQLAAVLSVGDRDYYKIEFKTSWFFKGFSEHHTLQLLGKAGVTQTLGNGDVPFYDRFYLGGQDSLRGFDYRGVGPREVSQDGSIYEPIGGDSYWLATAEYTIPIIDRLSFAVFYDIGNVSQRAYSNAGETVRGRAFTPPGGGPIFGSPPGLYSAYPALPYDAGNTRPFSDDFGVGIRLTIPTLGPLRLDYGIPLHHDSFNGSGGKFQFGAGFSRPL